MEMKKKEAISRLKFWIQVLENEETPEMVSWEDFCHIIKISALSRMDDYVGKMYTPEDILHAHAAITAMERAVEYGNVYDRDAIRKDLKDYGVEKFDDFLVEAILDDLVQFD